jgi:type IV secretory pathway protease TraF
MAPTLLGPHIRMDCPACKANLAYGMTDPLPQEIVCQYCATLIPVPRHPVSAAGDHVQFRRFDPAGTPLRRFDIVVVRSRTGLVVKRLVGLPGETVGIAEGDLWINGKRLCKSLEEFRKVAVLVSEERRPNIGLPDSRWKRINTVTDPKAVFQFQPLVNYVSPRRGEPGPICDAMTYNAGLSRMVHIVSDVVLAFETAPGSTHVEAQWELGSFDCKLSISTDPSRHTVRLNWLDSSSAQTVSKSWPRNQALTGPCQWMFGSVDGRIVVGHNGALVPEMPEIAVPDRTHLTDEQWKQGVRLTVASASENPFGIGPVRVWRDIFYECAAGEPEKATARQLGDRECFVLGDNSANSLDSREKGNFGTITEGEIIGVLQTEPRGIF